MILLTDEEIQQELKNIWVTYGDMVAGPHDGKLISAGAKAQLKKMVEWMEQYSSDESNGKLYVFQEADLQPLLKEIE